MTSTEQESVIAKRRARKLVTMAAWRARNPNAKKEWDKDNFSHVQKYRKSYSESRKSERQQYMKHWRIKNREVLRPKKLLWNMSNRDSVNATKRKIERRNMATKPHFALAKGMKVLLQQILKKSGGKYLKGSTKDILGCDKHFFVNWIRSQFKSGMSFEQRNLWQLDHIFPIACCGNNHSSILLANHYRNLRPLWTKENAEKRDNLSEESIVSAYMCGITEIFVAKKTQAKEQILTTTERLGIKVVRGWL